MDPDPKEHLDEVFKTPSKDFENESNGEHSDSELEIDLNATLRPKKSLSLTPSKNEQNIIETIEDEVGKQLNEKAERSKLTVSNVRVIIREVLNNEHVRALLEERENDDVNVKLTPYEPKLTRAKAKELLSANTVPTVNIPWVPQLPPSETHVLIGEDLKEDDSGDEYVPGEEESEDDRDESVASESDVSSLPPPTPPTPVCMEDHATQTTNYTDDGVFKIPLPKTAEVAFDNDCRFAVETLSEASEPNLEAGSRDSVARKPKEKYQEEAAEEVANIALRTRSKINLSSTPLETIEKSFVPPDITTDMYDMECDDDEWREFLKGFTEPLEEVTKPTEDEEHDPEYNILADDEINRRIDNEERREEIREELRVDKAVKITKKEVKELWEELFDYLHNMSEEYDDQNNEKCQLPINEALESSFENTLQDISNSPDLETNDELNHGETDNICLKSKPVQTSSPKKKHDDKKTIKLFDFALSPQQVSILEQQFRQHVQMLTHNFILTYEHPELHHLSISLKEYLLNLKFLGEGKSFSFFRPVNLHPALKLIDSWVNSYALNSEVIKQTKVHVQQELTKSIHTKMAGDWLYVMTFPKFALETIANSEVFLYPSLLPKIPFKSEQFSGGRTGFTNAEDSLLAYGIEQFNKFLSDEMKSKAVSLIDVVSYIQQYMMPHKSKRVIYKHIHKSKHPRCATNPIQQYISFGKLMPIVHYIYPLDQIIPPCKRMPEELPLQWRNFVYPSLNNLPENIINIGPCQSLVPQQIILINTPLPGAPLFTSPFILTNSEAKTARKRPPRKSKRVKGSLIDRINLSGETNSSFNDVKKCSTGKRAGAKKCNSETAIEHLVSIFLRPIAVQKLVKFLADIDEKNESRTVTPERLFIKVNQANSMLPIMPNLSTLAKNTEVKSKGTSEESVQSSTTFELISTNKCTVEGMKSTITEDSKKPATVTSSTIGQENKRDKITKSMEFSTITSSSFQQANTSTEVEFYRNSSNIQICRTSQSDEHDVPSGSGYNTGCIESEKDNPEDINALLISSSTVKPEGKPNVRKELSGAVKKKNKLRKDFLANLSIATPEDPESEKHKNEMFAIAYYDKLREDLALEDYHKIMVVLNDFESGDVLDLYNDVQAILRPNYKELAEEFLFFLREKEASAVGQLIPWLELQARTKFLRKLEIYLKGQPAQLKKIYNTLMELTKADNMSMEKIKGVLVPMLKGNSILLDLFLQNFRDERPPPSLLEGPYETIDVNKELARPDNDDLYETFVVPNTGDKYGGQNCICHCHKIEDNEYKSRYKHCNSCGLKFANGKLYLSAGRIFQPATVTFKTSPHVNHNARLLGKSTTTTSTSHKKKRSDTSPNKLPSSIGKENLEEVINDTEDEELGKRKKSVSQKTPRKRKKIDASKYQENCKLASPKKSPGKCNESSDIQKDSIKPRKRTYSGRRSKKEESKKAETEIENEPEKVEDVEVVAAEKMVDEEQQIIVEVEESEHETSEEQPEKLVDDCMDSSGESVEKPLTPGQQTAESESEIYLEESSQDNYESDDSSSSMESAKGSQSDCNTNDEPPWGREEDTVILETLQKEDDKEYALQIISDKLPNRTVGQIRSRLSRLMDLLIETLKNT